MNMNFENAPFKLTREYVELLGGLTAIICACFKICLCGASSLCSSTRRPGSHCACFMGRKGRRRLMG